MNYRSLLCLAFVALLLTSCVGGGERAAMLDRADSLMSVSPALALGFTDSLISAGEGGGHFQSQLQLRRLNAKNKLDTVFTRRHVDEAKALTEHFDRHGTPNERMLAHYLLGRTYADTHEAPMALEAYQDAVACADTTAADCDYYQLCRVYSQMANIFYRQGLYLENLNHIDLSVRYALIAKDTIGALLSYAQKIGAYDQLNMGDSALFISKSVSSQFRNLGMNNLSAAFLSPAIVELVNRGQAAEAKQYMDIYESESGYFNDRHEIQKGHEKYYHLKGCYYLITHQNDSAEYYFRKEIREGHDYNNQNCGSHGLALLFQMTNRPDSATKYALFSHEMCDSFYAQRTTQTVEQVKGMYDYSRHQREAQQEKANTESKQRIIWRMIIMFVLFVAVVAYMAYGQIKKQKRQKAEYYKLLDEHVSIQSELMMLRSQQEQFEILLKEKEEQKSLELGVAQTEIEELKTQNDDLCRLISQKEEETERQKAKIREYQRVSLHRDEIENDVIYIDFLDKCNKGKKLTDSDWRQLEKLVVEHLPEFYKLVSSRKSALTIRMYHVCILIRLKATPMAISHMMGVKAPSITRVRGVIYKKLFGEEGSGKQLDQKLMLYN